ncbi:MAG: N-acetylmuramoyl-L-alanine amidase [Bacteriovoracales bacterium]|nr:N-acetylmuramoyl-L-alanine amidase [Bacteriovoracales bacterium]
MFRFSSLLWGLLLFFCISPLFVVAYGKTVIIDPGHGGEDFGAKISYWIKGKKESRMKNVLEKDLTLSLSKKIYRKLQKKGYRVYLTRTHDRTVSLESRSNMAEKVGADLFISIHANSSPNRSVGGIETFYLDNHKDKALKKVEQLENGATGIHHHSPELDPVVIQILRDLVVSKTAPLSKKLATQIHQTLRQKVIRKYGLRNRGIRPGLFYVLALSRRPAVLLEIGFLSNPKERKIILSGRFQDDYADAVVKGITQWGEEKGRAKPPLF